MIQEPFLYFNIWSTASVMTRWCVCDVQVSMNTRGSWILITCRLTHQPLQVSSDRTKSLHYLNIEAHWHKTTATSRHMLRGPLSMAHKPSLKWTWWFCYQDYGYKSFRYPLPSVLYKQQISKT